MPVSEALLDLIQLEGAWTLAKECPAQVDAPSLLCLQFEKLAALTGLHQEEDLTILAQVLWESLEGGPGGYIAAH